MSENRIGEALLKTSGSIEKFSELKDTTIPKKIKPNEHFNQMRHFNQHNIDIKQSCKTTE